MRPTIRRQITIMLIATTLLTLVLVGGIFLAFTAAYVRNLGRSYIEQTAFDLSDLIERSAAAQDGIGRVREILGSQSIPEDIQVRVLSPSGMVLFDSSTSAPVSTGSAGAAATGNSAPGWIFRPFVSEHMTNGERIVAPTQMPMFGRNGPWIMSDQGFVSPTRFRFSVSDQSGDDALIVELETPTHVLTQIMRSAAGGFALAAALSLFVAVVLASIAAKRITLPIHSLAGIVASVDPEKLAADPEILHPPARGPRTPREILTLHERFYTLATRLSAVYTTMEHDRDSLKTFLADASHELRTPLTAASTFADLIETKLVRGSREPAADLSELSEYAGDLRRQLTRMERIVSTLLSLSRIEAGIFPLSPEPVAVRPIIESVVRDLSIAYPHVHAEIDASGIPAGFTVTADAHALETVMSNILENSFLYGTEEDPEDHSEQPPAETTGSSPVSRRLRLYFEIERTPTGGDTADCGTATILVSDRGPGVPDGEIGRIGTRFYRGTSAKSDRRGLGLGLSMTKSLVERMGGAIEFSAHAGFQTRLSLLSSSR